MVEQEFQNKLSWKIFDGPKKFAGYRSKTKGWLLTVREPLVAVRQHRKFGDAGSSPACEAPYLRPCAGGVMTSRLSAGSRMQITRRTEAKASARSLIS